MGTGRMAGIMADTVRQMPDAQVYAVASRDAGRAAAFVSEHFPEGDRPKAFGSYEQMVSDPRVEMVYVATPHSEHFSHAMLAVRAGRPVLCEKSFCGNARQARELISAAEDSGVFIGEAMWIRYKPFVKDLPALISTIDPQMLVCSLGYPKWFKPVITERSLCGGAMMDLGVYLLNFARICFGSDVADVKGHCIKSPETGLDVQDCISLIYSDSRLVNMQCSVMCANDRQGMICGKNGYIIVDNINNPQEYRLFDKDHQLVKTLVSGPEISGYEYEVRACIDAIRSGRLEPSDMPHSETLAILDTMDSLRRSWGIIFPCDR